MTMETLIASHGWNSHIPIIMAMIIIRLMRYPWYFITYHPCFYHYLSLPIASMVLLFMVTFTINVPPMLIYQHHGSVMGYSPWPEFPLAKSPWFHRHGFAVCEPRGRLTGPIPSLLTQSLDTIPRADEGGTFLVAVDWWKMGRSWHDLRWIYVNSMVIYGLGLFLSIHLC